jgi:hypothetical protein
MGRTRAGKKENLSFVDTVRHMKSKKDLEEKKRNRKKRQEENRQKRELASQ